MAERAQVRITGVVQGVGFRPYVHALATRLGILGFVANTADGVVIEAEGERLAEFLDRLPKDTPSLSRVSQVTIDRLPLHGYSAFAILASRDQADAFTLLSPDVTLCADCLRELLDPSDRRYLYPFINCTNCGPRYSITRRVPYDRPNTTMSGFIMCPDCSREYGDPGDRRFHAQPNACPACGPSLEFNVQGTRFKVTGTPMEQCISVLQQGGIVAIKGIGGYHLACDAANDAAVGRLRERKRKSNKPFGLMFRSFDAVEQICDVCPEERLQLLSPQRPLVLLRRKPGNGGAVAGAVAPVNRDLGCMLPYTPLHALLFEHPAVRGSFKALVMTSGNLAEEPIVRDNEEAVKKLSGIADAFMHHDRDIYMRVDDSVIRIHGARPPVQGAERVRSSSSARGKADPALAFIRRSRGYAPDPVQLQSTGPEVMGCGADLKCTFTLTKGTFAIPSQHIGDMENYETLQFYEETLANLKQVYRVEPSAIVHDLHPGYLSTKWAKEQGAGGRTENRPAVVGIQHHYAHIGSVMAEHGLTDRIIGVAFDGTGYGTDGNLWGAEFLLASVRDFERKGQFRYVRLPGGEAAIREPWRTAVSYAYEAFGDGCMRALEDIGFVERHGAKSIESVLQVRAIADLSPLASGAGRLFDAVASLVGLCDRNSFEGEAAMALEAAAASDVHASYAVEFREERGYTFVDFSTTVTAICRDLAGGTDRGTIAARFHNTVADVIAAVAGDLGRKTGIEEVALSGGTFQNQYLIQRTIRLLERNGMHPLTNGRVPANDGGISLGQAYIVRERLKTGGAA